MKCFPGGEHLSVSYLSHKAYDISQPSLQLQTSPPVSILSSQICNNLIISRISILKSASKVERGQGQTDTHTQSQCEPIGPQKTTLKTPDWAHHWPRGQCGVYGPSKLAVTCTGLCHTERCHSPGCSTLAWKSKRCLLQWIDTSRAVQTAGFNDTALEQPRSRTGSDRQNSKKPMFIPGQASVLGARGEVGDWVAMEIFQK